MESVYSHDDDPDRDEFDDADNDEFDDADADADNDTQEGGADLMPLYWICNQFGGVRNKWETLVHNGVMFPPEYQVHHVPVLYDTKPVELDPRSEEVATFYAKYLGTDYVKNPRFNRNFWRDWRDVLGPDHVIQSFDLVDFTPIHEYLEDQREAKKEVSPEQKETLKEQKEREEAPYRVAVVDGKEQPVGNFRVEPPGLFLGRGNHPKTGMVKRRIYPEDVTLNLSADAPIPATLPGHQWGEVISDKSVDWLASWKDDITGKTKYVWLGALSDIKGKSDMAKFETARRLKRRIKGIREENIVNMASPDPKLRQIATAVYLIDTFALRVGGEVDTSERADTIGVNSLRVEHVTLLSDYLIKLDFLGKDSVRYLNVIPVLPIVYENIADFMRGKAPGDDLFDLITPSDINKYLQTFMKGLTAKVFRTFNASNIFSKELRKVSKKYDGYEGDDREKLLLEEFNKANIKVAKLMNHQKNISKSHGEQIEKLNTQIKALSSKLRSVKTTPARAKQLRKRIKDLKTKKKLKSELKNLSLGTSKINYIDPRVTVSFVRLHGFPLDKLFTKAMMDKFKWAFDVGPDFVW